MAENKKQTLQEECARIASYAAGLSLFGVHQGSDADVPFKGMEKQLGSFLSFAESLALGYKTLSVEIEAMRREKKERLIRENESRIAGQGIADDEGGYDNSPFAMNNAGYGDENEHIEGTSFSVGVDSDNRIMGITTTTKRLMEKLSVVYEGLTGKGLDISSENRDAPVTHVDEFQIEKISNRAYSARLVAQLKEVLVSLKENSNALSPILGLKGDFLKDEVLATSISNLTERCIDSNLYNPYAILREGINYYFGPEVNDIMDGLNYYGFDKSKIPAEFYTKFGDPYTPANFNNWLKTFTGIVNNSISKSGNQEVGKIKGDDSQSLRWLEQLAKASAYCITMQNTGNEVDGNFFDYLKTVNDDISEFSEKLGMIKGRDFIDSPTRVDIDSYLERLRGKTDSLYISDEKFMNSFMEYSQSYNEFIKNENETVDRLVKEIERLPEKFNENVSEMLRKEDKKNRGEKFEDVPNILERNGIDTRDLNLLYLLKKYNAELKFKTKLDTLKNDLRDLRPESRQDEKFFNRINSRIAENEKYLAEYKAELDKAFSMDPNSFGGSIYLAFEEEKRRYIVRGLAQSELKKFIDKDGYESDNFFTEFEQSNLMKYQERLLASAKEHPESMSEKEMNRMLVDYAEDILTRAVADSQRRAQFYTRATAWMEENGARKSPVLKAAIDVTENYVIALNAAKKGYERSEALGHEFTQKAIVFNKENERLLASNTIERRTQIIKGADPEANISQEEEKQINEFVHEAASRIRLAEKYVAAEKQILDSRNSIPTKEYFYVKELAALEKREVSENEKVNSLGLYWEKDDAHSSSKNQDERVEGLTPFSRGATLLVTDRMLERFSSHYIDLRKMGTYLAEMRDNGLLSKDVLDDAYKRIEQMVEEKNENTSHTIEKMKEQKKFWIKVRDSFLSPSSQLYYSDLALKELNKPDMDNVKFISYIDEMLDNNPTLHRRADAHVLESIKNGSYALNEENKQKVKDWLRVNRTMEPSIYEYQERKYPGESAYNDRAIEDLIVKGGHFEEETKRKANYYIGSIDKSIENHESISSFLNKHWKAMTAISGTEKELYPVLLEKEKSNAKEILDAMTPDSKTEFDMFIYDFKASIEEKDVLEYSRYALEKVYDMALNALADHFRINIEEKEKYKEDVVERIQKFSKKKDAFINELNSKSLHDQILYYKSQIARKQDSPEVQQSKRDLFVNSKEMKAFTRWIAYTKTEDLEKEIKSNWENYHANISGLTLVPSLVHLIDYHLKGLNIVNSLESSVYLSSDYSEKEIRDYISGYDTKVAKNGQENVQRDKKINDFTKSFFPMNGRYSYLRTNIENGFGRQNAIKESALFVHLPPGMSREEYISALTTKARIEISDGKKRNALIAKLNDKNNFVEQSSGAYIKLSDNNTFTDENVKWLISHVIYSDEGKSTCYYEDNMAETFKAWNSMQSQKVKEQIENRNLEEAKFEKAAEKADVKVMKKIKDLARGR